MVNPLYQKHIISINSPNHDDLNLVLATAAKLKTNPQPELLRHKIIASCFFEASTHARLSFETSIHRLGAGVAGFSDSASTSLGRKDETLADTISVISTYVGAVMMRHPQEGTTRLTTEFSGNIPVLNTGDGSSQHPTQTLLDLFTIQGTQGYLGNLHIAMVDDLKYGRTVHSLAQALTRFDGNRLYFIAPDALAIPQYILDVLDEKGITWSLYSSIEEVMVEVDIPCMTRVQKERLDPPEYANVKAQLVLRTSDFHNAKANMKMLHPLPRIDETATDVNKTPHAWCFQQAGNGIFTRRALLALVLNRDLVLQGRIEITHNNKLQAEAIKRSTVIDHILAQIDFKLLSLFKLTETDQRITIGLNLPSGEMGCRDLIKIENTFLNEDRVDQLALYAPQTTVNRIDNYEVVDKSRPNLLEHIDNVLVCPDSNYISRAELVSSNFAVRKHINDIALKCKYCEKEFSHNMVLTSQLRLVIKVQPPIMSQALYHYNKGEIMNKTIAAGNAPAAIGPYMQGVDLGNMIITPGQIPVNPKVGEVSTDVAAQARQSLDNVKAIVGTAGLRVGGIVKTTVFVKDLNDLATVNTTYEAFFTEHNTTFPARSCIKVAHLPKDVKIEIEAIAVRR